jgi:MYXO-CTERM domain-containing protein
LRVDASAATVGATVSGGIMKRSAFWIALFLPTTAIAGGLEMGSEESLGDDSRDQEWLDEQPQERDRPDAIINGVDATIVDYPMTGATVMNAYLESPFGSGEIRTMVCSSTLIAPDVVLLASHCLDEEAFTFGFGSLTDMEIAWTRQSDLSAHDGSRIAPWPEDAVFAQDWVKHQSFSLNDMQVGLAQNYDIALLFLEEPLLDIEYAYLPTVEEVDQILVGNEVDIVGWGQQVATSMWEQPPPGTYAVKQIGTSFINELSPWEFQVGAVETDVRKCHGDSGGPTFMEVETDSLETTRLIGVTSHAYDMSDCSEKGGVDTRVDEYLEWIDTEMRLRCDDGSRVWCEEPGIIPLPMPEEGLACGCSAVGPASAGAWSLFLVGLLGLRRRRRDG